MSINDQLIGVSACGTITVFGILQSSPLFKNDEITTLMHIKQSYNGVLPRELFTLIYHQRTFPSGSGMRNNAETSDDFPAPVRPTTPTFSLLET